MPTYHLTNVQQEDAQNHLQSIMQHEQHTMPTMIDPTEQAAYPSVTKRLSQNGKQPHRTNGAVEKRIKTRANEIKLTQKQLETEISELRKSERHLQNRIAFEHIITTISTQFINLAAFEIDANINQALEKIGRFTNCDRCYIYLFEENGRALKNTHSWCRPTHRPTLEDFQMLPADLFQNWMPQLLRGETVQIQNIQDDSQENSSEIKLLHLQEVRSALIIPLVHDKDTFGFFGLDSYQPFAAGQQEKFVSLKAAGTIFASILMRKKREERLAEERNFAQQIMATMGQGVITTTAEGIIEYINPACAHMLGCEPSALIGKTALEFTQHEDHPKLIRTQMQNMEGQASSYEACLQNTNGSPLNVLINSVPNYNHQGRIIGSIATITDLTEQRAVELQNKQFVENATDMIYRTDAEGYLTYANPRTLHILGYEHEKDLIGQLYSDFIHPDFREKMKQAYARQQAQRIANTYYEFIALNTRGEEIWLGQNVQLIMKQDEVVGFQALARDITQRRAAEESLRARSNELNATNAKLAKALRAKDEFLANMSHELRTPLNTILGKSEILLEGIHGHLTEKQASSLQVIEKSGRHLLELINDILDMSKIEAGRVSLDIQTISLASLCENSLQFVRQMAHRKQIKLRADVDPSLKTCQADERRLKQILINLLSNALKFTSAGGEVGLNVLANTAKETVQFQVWDTGVGISAKEMEQLFMPFVQLDSSLARSHEGTGLGLSLVYHLTEMHGGSVSLESQVGVGSCFTITLPQNPIIDLTSLQNQAKNDREEYEEITQSLVHYAPGDEPLILLVENNETNIQTTSEYLSIWGYRLTVARNGTEAMEKAREEKPDCILLDIQISEMDSLTAVRQLRQELGPKQVPIITLTALTIDGDRERCLSAGASEYLSKPIQLRQLVMLINKLLIASDTNQEQ